VAQEEIIDKPERRKTMYYTKLQVVSKNLVVVLELSKDMEVLTYSKPLPNNTDFCTGSGSTPTKAIADALARHGFFDDLPKDSSIIIYDDENEASIKAEWQGWEKYLCRLRFGSRFPEKFGQEVIKLYST
jgi:hypothetical protein